MNQEVSPDVGINYQALRHLNFPRSEVDEGYRRSEWSDEFKRKVKARDLSDLPTFSRLYNSGVMHETVTFIEYRRDMCEKFGFEKNVGIHRDGTAESGLFKCSMIYPLEYTDGSYINWYAGSEETVSHRTGTYCPEEHKLYETDRYYFSDTQNYPVIFRVDQWHGVKIATYGRKLMRWLFKDDVDWKTAREAGELWVNQDRELLSRQHKG